MTTISARSTAEIAGLNIEDHIREVTDDEVARFEADGWVKLEALLSEDLTAELLALVQQRGEEAGMEESFATAGAWGDVRLAVREGYGLFAEMVFSRRMGANASKLINRARVTDEQIPIRYFADGLGARPGQGRGPSTHFHQDYKSMCQDRTGGINIWIGLAEIGPDQGGMMFLTGSHHEGRLGSLYADGMPDSRLVENRYPSLSDTVRPKLTDTYELAPSAQYRPGDATVHGPHTVHGSKANMSDDTRWNYVVNYVADDVRYDGSPNDHIFHGLDLVAGQRFDLDERFPVVYP